MSTENTLNTSNTTDAMDAFDECNFPELLALDLESAESVFASKRMTAGPPRLPTMPSSHSSSFPSSSSSSSSSNNGMGVIFESKSIQDLVEANILSTQDALAYTSARNFLSSDAFAQLQSHADAITRLTTKTTSNTSPPLGSITTHTQSAKKEWDSDSNSIDSFELPSISLSRPAAPRSLGHSRKDSSQSQSRVQSHPQYTQDEFLQPRRYGDSLPPASTSNRDSYISYGSFYDSYYNQDNEGDIEDEDDNDNDDCESVSSYGMSVPTARGRQQSVVTAATSVSSGCRHSTQSTQSRAISTASIMAPSLTHDKCDPEPVERHVEFDLTQVEPEQPEQTTQTEAPPSSKASPIPVNINKSSWMSFDDDDEDEPFTSAKKSPASALPPRPKTSSGSESRRQVPDFSEMAQWTFNKRRMSQVAMAYYADATPERPSTASASIAPSMCVSVPRRRSSLNHQSRPTPQFPPQLRHFHTFGDESGPGSVPADVQADDDEPVILQRTVYRKPVPEPNTRPSKKPRHREALSVSSNNNSQARPSTSRKANKTFAEPLSQFYSYENGSDYGNENAYADFEDEDMDDSNLFGDFAGAYNYDEGHDKIMMATVVPFSRQNTLSLRSLPSRSSLVSHHDSYNASGPELHPMPRHHTLAHHRLEETSVNLQSWIEHASRSQLELNQQYQRGAFYEEAEVEDQNIAEEAIAVVDAEPDAPSAVATVPQPNQAALPLSVLFHQPGLVGIPLPRDVVDTLRVSVSCFPETMLSLSSFSVQTIRTYSRKVRRRSQSDADSAHNLIMSTPFVPPLHMPPSPTDTCAGSLDIAPASGARANRSSTSTTSASSQSTGRNSFWKKLPKRLSQSRASSGLSLFHSRNRDAGSNSCNNSVHTSSISGRRGSRIDSFFSSASPSVAAPSHRGADDGQKSDLLLKLMRIFPEASDNLCESLYAHIIAFNYISLLCPPPEKRQTIHIYVDSNVPLPESADIMSTGDAMSVGRITPMPMSRLEDRIMKSPPSSPPPSRGGLLHGDDANNGVYNLKPKAVMLLGLLDIFEPEAKKGDLSVSSLSSSPALSASARLDSQTAPSNRNSLSRRYNSLRRRRLHNLSSMSGSTYKPATLKKAIPSSYYEEEEDDGNDSDTDSIARIKNSIATAKKTIAVPASLIDAPTPSAMADAAAAASAAAADEIKTETSTPPTVAHTTTAASAATDASMRVLHAGLYKCITQLVATMKIANGQLNTDTDVAGDIDPLFLRTLCELVRSQEEQR